MREKRSVACLAAALFLIVPAITISQNANKNRALIINGQSTQVHVIQVNGRSFVDLEALASAVNGSVSSSGNQLALSVPVGPATSNSVTVYTTPASAPVPASISDPGFSKGFLNSGIEQMATLREWHAALVSALQSGYPVTAAMLAPYRAQATTNLRLASVAASTASDHSAYQLLGNEFQNMSNLADKYIAARASMTYIPPDALQNDSLNQRIVSCGHSLGAMAASGRFSDDGSCN